MRLTALHLANYGSFQSERITFSARPGTLNLLMAPNGGGKSVLRSAFCDLLFGIGGQSPMGFRYGYPGMFAAYNAGPGRFDAYLAGKRPLPDETIAYLSAIAPGSETVFTRGTIAPVKPSVSRSRSGIFIAQDAPGALFVTLSTGHF